MSVMTIMVSIRQLFAIFMIAQPTANVSQISCHIKRSTAFSFLCWSNHDSASLHQQFYKLALTISYYQHSNLENNGINTVYLYADCLTEAIYPTQTPVSKQLHTLHSFIYNWMKDWTNPNTGAIIRRARNIRVSCTNASSFQTSNFRASIIAALIYMISLMSKTGLTSTSLQEIDFYNHFFTFFMSFHALRCEQLIQITKIHDH